MRFLSPKVPAGRLEFVFLQIAFVAVLFVSYSLVLDLSLLIDNGVTPRRILASGFGDAIGSGELVYDEWQVAGFMLIAFAVLGLNVITVMRRLTDIDKSYAWLVIWFLPIFGTGLFLYLAMKPGIARMMVSPYGKNALDPQSWIKPGTSGPKSGLTWEGRDITLPGDDESRAA